MPRKAGSQVQSLTQVQWELPARWPGCCSTRQVPKLCWNLQSDLASGLVPTADTAKLQNDPSI